MALVLQSQCLCPPSSPGPLGFDHSDLYHALIPMHSSHETLPVSLLVVLLKHSQDFAQKLNLKVQSLHRLLWYIQSQLFIFPCAALWDCANTEGETGFQFSKSCLGIWPCGRGSRASRCSFARSSGSLPAFQWEEREFQLEMITLLRDHLLLDLIFVLPLTIHASCRSWG